MIRDVFSNKRFFNMDLDVVNDRLWNGYYLTPDRFVYDIQCMVHDSKVSQERDRTNKAEEMLVNTQSYISEVFDETLVLECQRMAKREFERLKIAEAEREAKAKRKAEREKEKERLKLAAAAQQNQEGQSPSKMIEFPAAGDVQMIEANGDNNPGLGIMVNGNGDGSVDDSIQFVPESSPFGSQQIASESQLYPTTTRSTSPTRIQPFHSMPSQNDVAPSYNSFPQSTSQPNSLAQLFPLPAMPPAFTQRQPFPSPYPHANNTSGMYPQQTHAESTGPPPHFRSDTGQSMGGFHVSPSFPPQFSYPANHPYQPPHTPGQYGAPQPALANSSALVTAPLNHGSPSLPLPQRPSVTHHPSFKKDPPRVERLLLDVTRRTEGYTLEQLEQVYAACMDIIWRLRHEWDRTVVITETENCVRRVLSEIGLMEKERQQDRLDIK